MTFIFLFSCNSSNEYKINNEKNNLESKISRIEKILTSDTTGNFNVSAAHEAIKYYSSYSSLFPDDSITPEYIFRMANILYTLGKGHEAIEAFHKIESKYPRYQKIDICIFMQGNIYESVLNDTTQARKCYERYLKLYPSTELANDVKVLLQNLGKSPEQLYRDIVENNKKQIAKKVEL